VLYRTAYHLPDLYNLIFISGSSRFKSSSDMTKRNITTDANHADCLAKRICTPIEHNSEDTDLIFVFAEEDSKIIRSFTRQHLRQALEEPRRRRMQLIEKLARQKMSESPDKVEGDDWNWLYNEWYDYFDEWPLDNEQMKEAILHWKEWFKNNAMHTKTYQKVETLGRDQSRRSKKELRTTVNGAFKVFLRDTHINSRVAMFALRHPTAALESFLRVRRNLTIQSSNCHVHLDTKTDDHQGCLSAEKPLVHDKPASSSTSSFAKLVVDYDLRCPKCKICTAPVAWTQTSADNVRWALKKAAHLLPDILRFYEDKTKRVKWKDLGMVAVNSDLALALHLLLFKDEHQIMTKKEFKANREALECYPGFVWSDPGNQVYSEILRVLVHRAPHLTWLTRVLRADTQGDLLEAALGLWRKSKESYVSQQKLCVLQILVEYLLDVKLHCGCFANENKQKRETK